jgi:prepilin-type N-terminal cleavage/methylation domain-containing protein/prepilin-type processing-associated H-X9-DG protein
MKTNHRATGFTIIELLVVISIIGVLTGLLLPALAAVRNHSNKVRELSAARTLMFGYTLYADDHDGWVMPGYAPGEVFDARGNPIENIAVQKRYVYKIAPYLDYEMRDSVLVNVRRKEIDERMVSGEDETYWVSVMPSLGLNAQFVGGHEQYAWLPHIRRINEPGRPSDLIVFASARATEVDLATKQVEGYFEVRPPISERFIASESAFKFGFVHPRYKGKAVIGFFDGHAGTLDERELTDMQHWCDEAARNGDPDWEYTPPAPTPWME